MNDRSTAMGITALAVAAIVVLVFVFGSRISGLFHRGDEESAAVTSLEPGGPKYAITPRGATPEDATPPADEGLTDGSFAKTLIDFILALAENPNAIRGEAVLRFKDAKAYRDFLSSAAGRGIKVLGQIDPFRAVRIGFDNIGNLRENLDGLADSLDGLEGNIVYSVPDIPVEIDQRSSTGTPSGFGSSLLEYLGIAGENSTFGQGVKVAVIDSGVAGHPTFEGASIAGFHIVDGGFKPGTGDVVGHGTAVTSLIAGQHAQAPGIAPGADVNVYGVTSSDGTADAFSIASGILAAVDSGSQIINISLGSYGDSTIMRDAINYAIDRNVLVVAASGNEQRVDAVYPAKYDGVVSVGPTDASGNQLWFGNSSPTLDFGAPGYEINAAYPDDGLVQFTGTSASSPIVAGAVAAVMSEMNLNDPYRAVELLRTTANEAGAPGRDTDYGFGELSVQRALDSTSRGITDAAVASHFHDLDGALGYGPNTMLFVVENRGTEVLANVPITVSENGVQRTHVFPVIQPNESGVYALPVNQNLLDSRGAITYQSRVLYPAQSDANSSNNVLATTLTAVPQQDAGGEGGAATGTGDRPR